MGRAIEDLTESALIKISSEEAKMKLNFQLSFKFSVMHLIICYPDMDPGRVCVCVRFS